MAVSFNRLCQYFLTHAFRVIVAINMVTFLIIRFSSDFNSAIFSRLALSPNTPAALLSYMWIHIDLTHFLLNMLLLTAASVILSRHSFPQPMIYATFLAGGIAGGLSFIITAPDGQSIIGASCGVLALCGAVIFRLVSRPSRFSVRSLLMLIPATVCIIYILWSNPTVAPAHFAGLVIGIIAGKSGFRIARLKALSADRRTRLDSLNNKIRRSGFSSLTETERDFIFDNINR